MVRVLVESSPDPASVGIADALRTRPGWHRTNGSFEEAPLWSRGDTRLVTIDEVHIHAEGLDERLRRNGLAASSIVFLSKHKSQSGRPTLTAHPVGNFTKADFGGTPGRLTPCRGEQLTHMLRCLDVARRALEYPAEVAYETTHHGPLLDVPCLFVELGSSDAQWDDRAGHEVVAEAVTRFLDAAIPSYRIVAGLGGGHYAPRFTEAALSKQVHFSHMLPTHYAKAADPPSIAAEIRRASPGADAFYYHDGTLPREVREPWFAALQAAGLRKVDSSEWSPLAGPNASPGEPGGHNR
ncbi:MAG: hypothetical protein HYT80_04305 [Euryarchaeota archaeon]|nr:hypothetical protein [Euryarchaeota archaeon]